MHSTSVWVERPLYEEAERKYYEKLSKATLTPLADEVAKARQRLIECRDNFDSATDLVPSIDAGAIKFYENKIVEFQNIVYNMENKLDQLNKRLSLVESYFIKEPVKATHVIEVPKATSTEDEDVDLFGSDSDDDESAAKIKEERLAAYNAKKSKKPALIAKSSIIFDVKPWGTETDMKKMEEGVRKITMDGLLWGASKLVPLAFGIYKLQINCVIEDDKISVDELQEEMENITDYVQSVDIAAFNKI